MIYNFDPDEMIQYLTSNRMPAVAAGHIVEAVSNHESPNQNHILGYRPFGSFGYERRGYFNAIYDHQSKTFVVVETNTAKGITVISSKS